MVCLSVEPKYQFSQIDSAPNLCRPTLVDLPLVSLQLTAIGVRYTRTRVNIIASCTLRPKNHHA